MATNLVIKLPSTLALMKCRPPSIKSRSNAAHKIYCKSELPVRRTANYHQTLWTDDTIQSLNTSSTTEEKMNGRRIQMLKEQVVQLIHESKDVKSQLELIDELDQLGVSYHFKEEIHNALWDISNIGSQNLSMILKDDLSATSLLFRLLRQNGFDVSQDIFINFKDKKGDYKSSFQQDIKGILNLYEASYLAKEGESVMDEARTSTIKQLQNLLDKSNQIDPYIREHIAYALELPLDRRVTRLHNRWYIEAPRTKQSINPNLLELAKLDYNALQMVFKHELKDASRWWEKLGLKQALPFTRDRIVESYFMSVGFAFEPQHKNFREASMKVNCIAATIDDIYDLHGTLDELELFTNIVNSWDINAIHQLPEYMKICFMALINHINETTDKIRKQNGFDISPYLKRAWADICNSFLVEARWYHKGHKPKFEEYLDNAWITITGGVLFMHAYCVNEHITQRVPNGFVYPSIAVWSSTIARLCNDLATSQELQRGDVPKSMECYMHKFEVPEAIARQNINVIINDYWKRVNAKRIYSSSHEKFYNDVAINIARMAHCLYQYGDGYGEPRDKIRENIISALMNPIM